MAWRLAIDFGTSNTAAAVDVQGSVRPIALSDGGITMPSAVVLTPTGFRVGEEAINAQLRHPDGFERTPKALIGRGDLVLAGQIVSPEQLITEVYQFVRAAALRRQNNEEPSEVWLTHPVAWAPSQIEALRNGAVEAGFAAEAIRTVPEPIAAAAHYARNHQAAPGSRVAVFDFGGGTLDIAVLERNPQLPVGYRVLAYGGDPVLGGRTFDARLLDWTLDTLSNRGHKELAERLHRPKTMSELRAQTALSRAVTAAKTELSTRPDADISVSLGDEDAVVTITRSEYERLIAGDLERAGKLLTDVFDRVAGPPPEVLYLTGGSSRTPSISAMIRERSSIEIATLDDPKLVVPEGALHVGPVSRRALDQSVQRSQTTGRIPGGPVGPPQGPPPNRPPQGPPRQGPPPQGRPPQGAPSRPPAARPQQTGPIGPDFGAAAGPATAPVGRRPGPSPSAQPQRTRPQPDRAPGNQPRSAQPPRNQPSRDSQSARPVGLMSGATGASGSAPTGPGAAKKKPRTGLMIGLAAGAVVVIGGIVAAIGLNGGFGGGGDGEEPQAGPVVPTGSIECWDGSTASGGANCAALSGAAALDWIVRIDGARCSETTVEGAIAKDCTWYDLPNSHLFVMEFDSHDLAVQYGEDAYGNSGSNWKIGADTAGTSWEGGFDTGSGGYSHYYVYEDQPFAVFVRLDNNANGNHDRLSSISSRFSFKPLEDVDYAVATTKRA